jgi:hypothetical protein
MPKRKTVDLRGGDHGFQILDPSLHGDAFDLPLGHATAAGVVADEGIVATQLGHPVARK